MPYAQASELACDDRLPSLLRVARQQSQGELFDRLDKWLERQQQLVDSLLRNQVGQRENEVSRVGQCEDEPVPAERHDSAERSESLPQQPDPAKHPIEEQLQSEAEEICEVMQQSTNSGVPQQPGPPDPAKHPIDEQLQSQAEELHVVMQQSTNSGVPKQPGPPYPAKPPIEEQFQSEAEELCEVVRQSTNSEVSKGWLAVEKAKTYRKARTVSIAISIQQGVSEASIHMSLQKQVSVRMISDWRFDFFFSVAVFLNAVLIGVEVNYAATHVQSEDPPEFAVMQHCFTAIFFLELLIRVCAGGLTFFCASSWNILDTALVFASLLEVCLHFSSRRRAMR
eukprot:TRINITY_DN10619_c0_g1_i2.p2 TRINITY_DN10619_c0_g1~~TRINITY_DN10619_c0_g1_i2.p2  ORF type:complete len:349 (+),score=60.80 TRINITY_DN10619_c0_g1_i2:33-1049(+)